MAIFGRNFGGEDVGPVSFGSSHSGHPVVETWVGQTKCRRTKWTSATYIRCKTVPAGVGAGLPVIVKRDGLVGTAAGIFSYDAPIVRSSLPLRGEVFGDDPIVLTGYNMGLHNSTVVVRLGGVPCVRSWWISDSKVGCRTPESPLGTEGLVNVTVEVGGVESLASTSFFKFYIPRVWGNIQFSRSYISTVWRSTVTRLQHSYNLPVSFCRRNAHYIFDSNVSRSVLRAAGIHDNLSEDIMALRSYVLETYAHFNATGGTSLGDARIPALGPVRGRGAVLDGSVVEGPNGPVVGGGAGAVEWVGRSHETVWVHVRGSHGQLVPVSRTSLQREAAPVSVDGWDTYHRQSGVELDRARPSGEVGESMDVDRRVDLGVDSLSGGVDGLGELAHASGSDEPQGSQVDRSPLIQDFLLLFLVGVCGSVAVVIGARRLFMRRSSMLAPRAVNIS